MDIIETIARIIDPIWFDVNAPLLENYPGQAEKYQEAAREKARTIYRELMYQAPLPEGLPIAMNRELDGSVIGYMDITDFECELGAASDGNRVYPDVESLKKEHAACIDHCGIVKVKVTAIEVIQAPKPEED